MIALEFAIVFVLGLLLGPIVITVLAHREMSEIHRGMQDAAQVRRELSVQFEGMAKRSQTLLDIHREIAKVVQNRDSFADKAAALDRLIKKVHVEMAAFDPSEGDVTAKSSGTPRAST